MEGVRFKRRLWRVTRDLENRRYVLVKQATRRRFNSELPYYKQGY
jgi:hypothetical protein